MPDQGVLWKVGNEGGVVRMKVRVRITICELRGPSMVL